MIVQLMDVCCAAFLLCVSAVSKRGTDDGSARVRAALLLTRSNDVAIVEKKIIDTFWTAYKFISTSLIVFSRSFSHSDDYFIIIHTAVKLHEQQQQQQQQQCMAHTDHVCCSDAARIHPSTSLYCLA